MFILLILVLVLLYVLYLNINTNMQIIEVEAKTNLIHIINNKENITHTHTIDQCVDPRTHITIARGSSRITHTRGEESSMLSHLSYKDDSLTSQAHLRQQCNDDTCAWCAMYMFDEVVRASKGEPVHYSTEVDEEQYSDHTVSAYDRRARRSSCDSKNKSRYERKGTRRQRVLIRAAKASYL